MKMTKEQFVKAKEAKSAEELIALAKKDGMEMSAEQAEKLFDALNKQGELNDEELEQVAGGWSPFDWVEDIINWFTDPDTYDVRYNADTLHYVCPLCSGQLASRGYEYSGEGDYEKYTCESCGAWFWHFLNGKYGGKWLKD